MRLSGVPSPAAPRLRHAGKLSAGLVVAAAGILVTTTRPGTATEEPRAVPRIVAAAEPVFFFDDAGDALSEHPVRAEATPDAAPPVETPPTRPDETSRVALLDAAVAGVPSVASPGPLVEPAADDRAAGDGDPSAAAAEAARPHARVDPPALAAVRERAAAPAGARREQVVVGAGDTLSGVLNAHGVSIEQMPALLDDGIVQEHLSNLRIGQAFTVTRLADGAFHSLSARIGDDTRITIRRTEDDFATAAIELPIEKERVVTSGTIEQSLYIAAEQADLKQSTIMTLADIFQWELDFARDIRQGDNFAVVYDRLYREGEYIGDGAILAAEFERGGRVHRAIRFTTADGRSGYYSPDGASKRRTFLRHPVDVVRITSKFDPARLHPVLHQIRAHRGVDYGAPHGSPIRATADGVIRFAGVRGAYGNAVVLQHGERTETLYAHMSRISDKSRVGQRVRQGEVIGYVGRSGRVTGTHLHYEFRVDGKHVDPLTVELPAAAPVAADERDALRAVSDELIAQMRSVLPSTEQAATRAASPDDPLAAARLVGEAAFGAVAVGTALRRPEPVAAADAEGSGAPLDGDPAAGDTPAAR